MTVARPHRNHTGFRISKKLLYGKSDMPLRLLLLSHAATPAMRSGRFPADDELDARGMEATQAWRARIQAIHSTAIFRSPALCAEQSATTLGLTAAPIQALAEADYGRWRGQELSDLAASEPDALSLWLSDPALAPHGGESFSAVKNRVGAWMDSLNTREGTIVALTHASVVRAAIVHALGVPTNLHARIEIGPLSLVEVKCSARGWTWMAAQPEVNI